MPQYEFTVTGGSSSASDELLSYIRKSFPPLLSDKFNSFRPALLATHGSAVADAASASGSGASTPAAYTPAPPAKDADEPIKKEQKKEEKSVGTTVTVEVKADLQASADDLWGLLTDENKIPMWSRSSAKLSLKAGSPYELFGGNVRGKVITAEPPKKLVQTWQVRSPSWPSGESKFAFQVKTYMNIIIRTLRNHDFVPVTRFRLYCWWVESWMPLCCPILY